LPAQPRPFLAMAATDAGALRPDGQPARSGPLPLPPRPALCRHPAGQHSITPPAAPVDGSGAALLAAGTHCRPGDSSPTGVAKEVAGGATAAVVDSAGLVLGRDGRLSERPAMIAAPALSVIIASLSGSAYLDACLAALTQQEGDIATEIIVAHPSDPAVADLVRQKYPAVRLIALPPPRTLAELRAA